MQNVETRFKEYEIIRLQAELENFEELMRRAVSICDRALGDGLYTKERLGALCREENHYFHCVMKGSHMTGIFYCFAEPFCETELYGRVEVSGLPADGKVGIAQSIALEDGARGCGVSEWLLNHGTKLLFEDEMAEAVLVPAWMKAGKIPADGHLKKCGYALLQVVKRLWASHENLRCSVCGTVPCSCDGAIYIRRREER